jgi:hypothetical protein
MGVDGWTSRKWVSGCLESGWRRCGVSLVLICPVGTVTTIGYAWLNEVAVEICGTTIGIVGLVFSFSYCIQAD